MFRSLPRTSLIIGSLLVVLSAWSLAPAAGETPSLVLERSASDGVYVSPARTGFEESMFTDIVEEARTRGVGLIIAVPFEAPPNTNAFARRVREAADADAAIVFGPDDVFAADASDEYEDNVIRALNAARAVSDPEIAASSFLEELTTDPIRERPEFFSQVTRWIWILALVVLITSVLEFGLRRTYREFRRRRHLAQQS